MEHIKTCIRKYADFTGRARRAEYWWFALAVAVVELVLYVLALILARATGSVDEYTGRASLGAGWIPMILLFLFGLAVIVPSLAVAVRRLHDTGKAGWFYFVTFIPVVGSLILLVFMIIDSTPGPNQYGPNPKGIGNGGFDQLGGGQQFGGVFPQQGEQAPGQYGQQY